MIGALQVLFALTVLASFGFAVPFVVSLIRRGSHDPVMAWHVVAFSAASGFEALMLELAARGVVFPAWVYVLAFGAVAGVAAWRLILYLAPMAWQWRSRWRR